MSIKSELLKSTFNLSNLKMNISFSWVMRPRYSLLPMKNRDPLLSGLFNSGWASKPSALNPSAFHLSYNKPLVLGNTIFSASRLIAILMALANALKIASILWCSLSPSALMFRLHFAASLNDLKK